MWIVDLLCKMRVYWGVKRKMTYIIITALFILITLIIPDVILELIIEGVHLLFEVLEESLDLLIETLFNTGTHETQIIVFYILISLIIFSLYKLFKLLPFWYTKAQDAWRYHKNKALIFMSSLSFFKKSQIILIVLTAIYFLI